MSTYGILDTSAYKLKTFKHFIHSIELMDPWAVFKWKSLCMDPCAMSFGIRVQLNDDVDHSTCQLIIQISTPRAIMLR